MIFYSLEFISFFLVFLFFYFLSGYYKPKLQSFCLLFGNCIFYGWVSFDLLAILLLSILLFYSLGLLIQRDIRHTKIYIILGCLIGVGTLLYFKYLNFFIEICNQLNTALGYDQIGYVNLLVPLGISFYTFKLLSYLFDIQNGRIKPFRNFVTFFNYVAFFPTILSGPIDKSRDLIPQFSEPKKADPSRFSTGLRQFLWGAFQKIVIADQIAIYTNQIFLESSDYNPAFLVLAVVLYAVQLYADFSGYSDMAIGIGSILGYNVTRNFKVPYFTTNIAQFWRGWHISLTSWLTEYLFTPLNIRFRNLGENGLILAIIINFTIIGMWHGANWTYLLFGLLHGLYYVPLIKKGQMNKRNSKLLSKNIPSRNELLAMIRNFMVVAFTFVFFRFQSWDNIIKLFKSMMSFNFKASKDQFVDSTHLVYILLLSGIFFLIEWLNKNEEYTFSKISSLKQYGRVAIYFVLIIMILVSVSNQNDFIYFKF